MKNKPYIIIAAIIIVASMLLGACSTPSEPLQERPDYKAGLEAGYKDGYETGQKDFCFDFGGMLNREGECVLPEKAIQEQECPVCAETPEVIVPEEEVTCAVKAQKLNVPEGMIETICAKQTNDTPPYRPNKSGVKIEIGTITFDAETRVWVLTKFVTPSQAKYAYDYEGRSQRILDSDFYYSETNPVNGGPFIVCYNTTDPGCEPPYSIDIYN